MALFVNGVEVHEVSYNGQVDNIYAPKSLYNNGVLVWPNQPPAVNTLISQDPNLIQRVISVGRRAGSDGVCNANHVRNWLTATNLTPGRKYAYFMTTSGDRAAKRRLSDDTVIISRGYNWGGAGTEAATSTWKMWADNGVGYEYSSGSYRVRLTHWGKFQYNPKTYTDSCGNQVYGHVLAFNTYEVSDAGKGDANVYIFDYAYFRYMMEQYAIPGWESRGLQAN